MAVYQVMFDVASGATGQLTKGDHVDLDDGVATWLNSQAEGALKPVGAEKPKAEKPKAEKPKADPPA